MRKTRTLALILALWGSGVLSAQEFLRNGDFEQDLSSGWTEAVADWDGDHTIDRSVSHHPDPDHEVMVRKYLYGYASLEQTVPVENTHLLLSADLRFQNQCQPNSEGKFSASALRVVYRDADDLILGETRIYHGTENCDWAGSPTLHLVAAQPSQWIRHRLRVRDELLNLPGVDTSRIAAITLSLYAYSTDAC